MSSAATPSFTPRHVVLARAAAAAIAAVMITFTGDHSSQLGLAVFSGFAVMTALVWALATWLVVPAGSRGVPIMLAVFTGVAGIVSGATGFRSPAMLFSVIITWAIVTGIIELAQGFRTRTTDRTLGRDEITVGGLTIILGLVLTLIIFIPDQPYYIEEAHQGYVLTSTIIAVGVFGAYAAILAVFLGIAGLSPQKPADDAESSPVLAGAPTPGKADND